MNNSLQKEIEEIIIYSNLGDGEKIDAILALFNQHSKSLVDTQKRKLIEEVRNGLVKFAIEGKDVQDEMKGITLYTKMLRLLEQLENKGDKEE